MSYKFPIIKPNCQWDSNDLGPIPLFSSIINDFRSIFHRSMYSARSSKDVLITNNNNNNDKLMADEPAHGDRQPAVTDQARPKKALSACIPWSRELSRV